MRTQKQKRNRVIKWIGGILAILVVFISVVAIYLSAQWKAILTEKIKEGVFTASNGLYAVNFKDIHLNLVTGSVVLDSLKLTPDTNVFKLLIAKKKAPSHLFRVKVAYLKLSRIKILAAYSGISKKEIRIEKREARREAREKS